MSYYLSKVVDYSFDDTITKIFEELKNEGFGVLTEIDVKETLKKKLDVDFRRYKILGACNPPLAYKALKKEENLGVMLPCNVIVQEKSDGKVQVSTINPVEAMKSVGNPELEEVAIEVTNKLKNVLDRL
ncbi:DUF302 domain-containing protein [Rosettibacter firmus]|uniref:DUF302 domain-containing protein n=1 Tax=Rosettibacter firmus TaxID=3111522 RepID=UPI00336BBCD6